MKSSGLTTILNGALLVCLAGCMIFCFQYIMLAREVRRFNADMAGINARRTALQSLVAECVEYSKKNPAILPVLETVGIKPPKPAAK
jgi:hypothetical protein